MIIGSEITLLIMFSTLLFQTQVFENVETVIIAVTGIFSLLLLALSISAYKKTGLRKILYTVQLSPYLAFNCCSSHLKIPSKYWILALVL